MPLPKPRHLLPLLALLAVGCRGVKVDTTHDPAVDFAAFRTFDLLGAPEGAPTGTRDARLFGLLEQELEKRGLRRSTEQPDLLVAVHRTVEGELNTRAWGYEFRDGRVNRYPMQRGALVVDLITAADRQSVWRGTAEGVFRAEEIPDERRAMLGDVLARMFADFPPAR